MTGFGKFVTASYAVRPAASYTSICASVLRFFENSEMSAPAENARPPSPDITTTRIASSPRNESMTSAIATHIAYEIALCFSGWLSLRYPTPPAFSAMILSVETASAAAGAFI